MNEHVICFVGTAANVTDALRLLQCVPSPAAPVESATAAESYDMAGHDEAEAEQEFFPDSAAVGIDEAEAEQEVFPDSGAICAGSHDTVSDDSSAIEKLLYKDGDTILDSFDATGLRTPVSENSDAAETLPDNEAICAMFCETVSEESEQTEKAHDERPERRGDTVLDFLSEEKGEVEGEESPSSFATPNKKKKKKKKQKRKNIASTTTSAADTEGAANAASSHSLPTLPHIPAHFTEVGHQAGASAPVSAAPSVAVSAPVSAAATQAGATAPVSAAPSLAAPVPVNAAVTGEVEEVTTALTDAHLMKIAQFEAMTAMPGLMHDPNPVQPTNEKEKRKNTATYATAAGSDAFGLSLQSFESQMQACQRTLAELQVATNRLHGGSGGVDGADGMGVGAAASSL